MFVQQDKADDTGSNNPDTETVACWNTRFMTEHKNVINVINILLLLWCQCTKNMHLSAD